MVFGKIQIPLLDVGTSRHLIAAEAILTDHTRTIPVQAEVIELDALSNGIIIETKDRDYVSRLRIQALPAEADS